MDWSWLGVEGVQAVGSGKRSAMLLLLGLVCGFGFIRTSTRLIRAQVRWWPGNVSARGVHLHHEFFGVMLMLGTGTLAFALSGEGPWWNVLGFAFGVGCGLVLDEFALLLHLQDVYWTQQGRSSIDAMIVAVALTVMLLLSIAPFGIGGIEGSEFSARWVAFAVVGINLALTLVCAVKGKPWIALFSVAVPLLAIVGSVRLAHPESLWARRLYVRRPHATDRAARRARTWDARKQRLVTLIGGAPTTTASVAPASTGTQVAEAPQRP